MPQIYTIHIHAIPLSDDDGGRGNTITPEQFAEKVKEASDHFKPTDLRFAFDPAKDWKPRCDTTLNSLNNAPSTKFWESANKVAAEHRGKLVVFLRWGADKNKPADNWFAYPPNTGQAIPARAKLPHDNIDFVAITNQADRFGSRAGVILAHETGHYLGLFHTHPGWGTTKIEDVIKLVKEEGAIGLNGDLLSDTPPDPCTAYYEEKVDKDLCGGPSSFFIEGVSFQPDRHNLMSYFSRCQPPVTISKQQIAVVRKTVEHKTRSHLIEASKGTRYAGVFRAGSDAHALWVGDDWDGFKAKCEEFSGKGLRLIDLETYVADNTRRYVGVFRAGSDAQALWVGDDWDGFKAKYEEFSGKGLRLIDLETYVDGNKRRYAGVFRAGNDAQALWVGDDWDGFEAKWKELSGKGLRLIDLETYVDGNKRRYAGVFRAGSDAQALWVGDDWDGFEAKWKELDAKGLRLIDIETYVDGNTRRYAGVFRAGSDAQALWVGDDWDGFEAKWKELSAKGFRLTDLKVYGPKVS
ncbi:MAG: hypothetical protein ACM65M_19635 [Microcoleus sp.]